MDPYPMRHAPCVFHYLCVLSFILKTNRAVKGWTAYGNKSKVNILINSYVHFACTKRKWQLRTVRQPSPTQASQAAAKKNIWFDTSTYRHSIVYSNTIAVRIRQPNIDSIFFLPAISLLVGYYVYYHHHSPSTHTQRTVNTRSKLKTAQTHTHTETAQRHPSINRNPSETTPHRRLRVTICKQTPVDTSRRIISLLRLVLWLIWAWLCG